MGRFFPFNLLPPASRLSLVAHLPSSCSLRSHGLLAPSSCSFSLPWPCLHFSRSPAPFVLPQPRSLCTCVAPQLRSPLPAPPACVRDSTPAARIAPAPPVSAAIRIALAVPRPPAEAPTRPPRLRLLAPGRGLHQSSRGPRQLCAGDRLKRKGRGRSRAFRALSLCCSRIPLTPLSPARAQTYLQAPSSPRVCTCHTPSNANYSSHGSKIFFTTRFFPFIGFPVTISFDSLLSVLRHDCIISISKAYSLTLH